MNLWTYHPPDFSLTEGRVDHQRSEYFRDVNGLPEAYRELCSRIGTDDQIIWCYTRDDGYMPTGIPRVEWALDVPMTAIIRFVDEIVWNRILGNRCTLPRSLYHEWKDEAIRMHPGDRDAQKAFIQRREEEFWRAPAPHGDWWDSLLVEAQTGESISALIHHPVDRRWIKGHRTRVARSPPT